MNLHVYSMEIIEWGILRPVLRIDLLRITNLLRNWHRRWSEHNNLLSLLVVIHDTAIPLIVRNQGIRYYQQVEDMYRIALSIALPEITHQPPPHYSVNQFTISYCLCQTGANQLHNIALCFGLRNTRKQQRYRLVQGVVVASEQKSKTSVTHERRI